MHNDGRNDIILPNGARGTLNDPMNIHRVWSFGDFSDNTKIGDQFRTWKLAGTGLLVWTDGGVSEITHHAARYLSMAWSDDQSAWICEWEIH